MLTLALSLGPLGMQKKWRCLTGTQPAGTLTHWILPILPATEPQAFCLGMTEALGFKSSLPQLRLLSQVSHLLKFLLYLINLCTVHCDFFCSSGPGWPPWIPKSLASCTSLHTPDPAWNSLLLDLSSHWAISPCRPMVIFFLLHQAWPH